jgi:hypothetical protein
MTKRIVGGPTDVKDIKASVRRRDGFCCVGCGMSSEEHRQRYKKQLHVHRKVPRSAYTIDGCVTLCYSCHTKEPTAILPEAGRRRPRQVTISTTVRPEELQYLKKLASRLDVTAPEKFPMTPGRALRWLFRSYLGEQKVEVSDG